MDQCQRLPAPDWGYAHESFVGAIKQLEKQGAIERFLLSRVELIWVTVFSPFEIVVHVGLAAIKFSASVAILPLNPQVFKPGILFGEAISHLARAVKLVAALIFVPLLGIMSSEWSVDLCHKFSLVKPRGPLADLVDKVREKAADIWNSVNRRVLSGTAAFAVSALAAHFFVGKMVSPLPVTPDVEGLAWPFYMGAAVCLAALGMKAYAARKAVISERRTEALVAAAKIIIDKLPTREPTWEDFRRPPAARSPTVFVDNAFAKVGVGTPQVFATFIEEQNPSTRDLYLLLKQLIFELEVCPEACVSEFLQAATVQPGERSEEAAQRVWNFLANKNSPQVYNLLRDLFGLLHYINSFPNARSDSLARQWCKPLLGVSSKGINPNPMLVLLQKQA